METEQETILDWVRNYNAEDDPDTEEDPTEEEVQTEKKMKAEAKDIVTSFHLLCSMKYFMAVQVNVADIRKLRNEIGESNSDLEEESKDQKPYAYKQYRKDRNGQLVWEMLTGIRYKKMYLYMVGTNADVERRVDNHKEEYFQLDEEFVMKFMDNREIINGKRIKRYTERMKFLKECERPRNQAKWFEMPADVYSAYKVLLQEERNELMKWKLPIDQVYVQFPGNNKPPVFKARISFEGNLVHEEVCTRDILGMMMSQSDLQDRVRNKDSTPVETSPGSRKISAVKTKATPSINKASYDDAPGLRFVQGHKHNCMRYCLGSALYYWGENMVQFTERRHKRCFHTR